MSCALVDDEGSPTTNKCTQYGLSDMPRPNSAHTCNRRRKFCADTRAYDAPDDDTRISSSDAQHGRDEGKMHPNHAPRSRECHGAAGVLVIRTGSSTARQGRRMLHQYLGLWRLELRARDARWSAGGLPSVRLFGSSCVSCAHSRAGERRRARRAPDVCLFVRYKQIHSSTREGVHRPSTEPGADNAALQRCHLKGTLLPLIVTRRSVRHCPALVYCRNAATLSGHIRIPSSDVTILRIHLA